MVRHVPYFLLIVPITSYLSHDFFSSFWYSTLLLRPHLLLAFIVTSTCFTTYLLYALQL
ncbi:hypothetical protein C8F04DRAFT_1120888, partial [Mycena alexandri]